ncbi:uncharacterized protein LOC131928412 isoform X2 [Physella acuta]|uniref:uncharacterized protein LOC131928412 isoform X2 n=1 Tax=Physella acuta TaxID=109671 RepID=UPI0027DDFD96|nr:uncharacterized protein LOC131928412 isoform X2 [Physella acuta]
MCSQHSSGFAKTNSETSQGVVDPQYFSLKKRKESFSQLNQQIPAEVIESLTSNLFYLEVTTLCCSKCGRRTRIVYNIKKTIQCCLGEATYLIHQSLTKLGSTSPQESTPLTSEDGVNEHNTVTSLDSAEPTSDEDTIQSQPSEMDFFHQILPTSRLSSENSILQNTSVLNSGEFHATLSAAPGPYGRLSNNMDNAIIPEHVDPIEELFSPLLYCAFTNCNPLSALDAAGNNRQDYSPIVGQASFDTDYIALMDPVISRWHRHSASGHNPYNEAVSHNARIIELPVGLQTNENTDLNFECVNVREPPESDGD